MDAFVDTFPDQAMLKKINECHLFLHATTLADISTANSTSIDPCAWFGQRLYSRRYQENKRTNTCDLGPTCWRLWQHALRHTLLHPQDHHLHLRQPLGILHSSCNDNWKWWFHPASCKLYCHHEDGTWTRLTLRRHVGMRSLFNPETRIGPD